MTRNQIAALRSVLFGSLAALLSGLSTVSCGTPESSARADLPNVILVTIDTLRPDHLGLYGYETETAPFIHSLGQQGAVFTNAFSTSSWTAPATASLFTGLNPVNHGVTLGIHAHRRMAKQVEREGQVALELNRIPDALAVLPEVFGAAGYTSFAVSTNLNVGSEMGFGRGFERMKMKNMASVEVVRERLERWHDEIVESEPWLLYLHLNDVHSPYEQHSPWYAPVGDERGDVVAAYDSEIRYVDAMLQEIVTRYASAGRPTLLALVSDHGEEFWERGRLGHRLSLNAEVNRVLFVVHAPALGVQASRHADNVSLVDVLPTLVDLVGIEARSESDGVSLAPLLRAEDGADALRTMLAERVLVAHRRDEESTGRELWSAIQGPWKLIEEGETRLLYDLRADPEEQNDLAPREAARARGLSEAIARLRAGASAPTSASVEISIDRERLEALRELGYVEE